MTLTLKTFTWAFDQFSVDKSSVEFYSFDLDIGPMAFVLKLSLDIAVFAVADPGFSWGGRQLPKRVC